MVNTGNNRGNNPSGERYLNGGHSHSLRGLPILVNDDWKKWDGVCLKFSGAPSGFGLDEVYHIFSDYGEIESMELFDNRSGVPDGSGRVKLRYLTSSPMTLCSASPC
jgi:RNA-dependent RNA polymerase